jgi:hypothetical protein
MRMKMFPSLLFLSGLPLGFGCIMDLPCQGDAQCSPSARCQEGECGELAEFDGDEGPELMVEEKASGESPGSGPPSTCGDLEDGLIDAMEVPDPSGWVTHWQEQGLDGFTIPVDLQGEEANEGPVQWHLAASGHPARDVALPVNVVDEQWFAPAFPHSNHVFPLEGHPGLLGVYRRSSSAIQLLGVVSLEEDHTLLTYEPALDVLTFPMAIGVSTHQEVSVYGTWAFNPSFQATLVWETLVDARGQTITPAGVFDTLRLRTLIKNRVPLAWPPYQVETQEIRYSFIAPCLGLVALVRSGQDESDLLFDQAAQIRVLDVHP